MASPSGSPEDSGKLRGRDGRQRREEEDAPPEEKRLKLGLEGGSAAQEEGEDAPRLGREETGTQTGGEGRGDDKCENSTLLSRARNSPEDSVLTSLAASKAEVWEGDQQNSFHKETAHRTHASGTYTFLDRTQHSDIKADCNTCVEIEDRKVSRQQMNCEREQLRHCFSNTFYVAV
uniref:RNA binding protein fox-1 homolog 1 isoform X2 n=1 Tax=Halichoerus grypus TaxID=9711 RepID=UPI001659A464|nr:RNA binding protein fox-1 homolog 1 isoform X2 [Halichoerus grypus]